MRLTPSQIAELRDPKNVRGYSSAGPLYRVSISITAYERLQELTAQGLMSVTDTQWWLHGDGTGSHFHLITNTPEYFVELEGMINDARQPRR